MENRSLKIAITADPELPVPPVLYGGSERLIDMVIRGLLDRGHDVTLFAHPDSSTPCRRVDWPAYTSDSQSGTIRNMWTLARAAIENRFDIIHSFGRLAYLLPLIAGSTPKIMTYQREITPRSIRWGQRLSRGTLHFSAISRHMTRAVEAIAPWHLVYNGVPMETYDFVESVASDAPLVFLGRIEPIKGTHAAIEIARRAHRKLVIAGNISPGYEGYFKSEIKPFVDGKDVTYIGPVDDMQKNLLLGSAAAFLMPIEWEEPFGLVMAEAMACGTPVLGLARGAVPEIVEDGVTGCVASSIDEIVDAVQRIPAYSRHACRARTDLLFSNRATVDGYEALYRKLVSTGDR